MVRDISVCVQNFFFFSPWGIKPKAKTKITSQQSCPRLVYRWNRLQGCQASVEDWQRVLQVHSLAASPNEDQRTWLKFASLCRSSGRLQQSRRVLTTLFGTNDPTPQVLLTCAGSKPEVSFAFMKHMWTEARLNKDTERKKAVLNLLHK